MILVKRLPLAASSSGDQPFHWEGDDLLLNISVQPRSSQNVISGIRNGHIRIKLTSAPVEGKANQALIKLLSKAFGVALSQVSIEKGETSKSKRIRIQSPKILPDILKNT